jgi:hypothetical protein
MSRPLRYVFFVFRMVKSRKGGKNETQTRKSIWGSGVSTRQFERRSGDAIIQGREERWVNATPQKQQKSGVES